VEVRREGRLPSLGASTADEGDRFQGLLERAEGAAGLIRERIKDGSVIHIASHLDADGLAAAGIMGKALSRGGGSFRIRIESQMDENTVKELAGEKPALTVFTDLGSGYLDILRSGLAGLPAVVLDHHQPVGEEAENLVQVNPHLHGIDGARDLSGAGVAYLVAEALDGANRDLACLAVVGALGDIQDKYGQRGLGGLNGRIVEAGVEAGCLEVKTDLLFFGRETRPIHQALAYTTEPFIPGISGEEDRSLALLTGLKIPPKHGERWRALRDLSEEEKKTLFSALADYLTSKGFSGSLALNLIGTVYTLPQEEPWTPLRDAREFASLLNATGRTERPGLGVALCMGDRGAALEEANAALEEYRRAITRYLSWLTEEPGRIQELDHTYVVRGDSFIPEKIIPALASILSNSLPKPEKPLIAFSTIPEENAARISARAPGLSPGSGLNLGEVMRIAAEKFSGRGGGHDVAAGAQVPVELLEPFLKFVDDMVGNQLGGKGN